MERPKEPAKNPMTPNSGHIDLRELGIDEILAAELRAGFATFAEDWDAPEMDIYDGGGLAMPNNPPRDTKVEKITVQPAEIDEVQQIKQVLSETWIDTYSSFLPMDVIHKITTLWHSPEGLAAEIGDERVCFSVAKDEHGAILGLVTAGRPTDEVVYIARLYVLPGHQRHGIGAKLLDACVSFFSGFQTLRLDVEAQNEKGLAFYRKQGFRETSRKVEELEGISLEVVEMEMQLT